MTWGIFDIDGNAWMGSTTGPSLYDDELVARAAMTVFYEMFNVPFGDQRFVVMPYDDSGTQLKDTITAAKTAHSALRLIETDQAKSLGYRPRRRRGRREPPPPQSEDSTRPRGA